MDTVAQHSEDNNTVTQLTRTEIENNKREIIMCFVTSSKITKSLLKACPRLRGRIQGHKAKSRNLELVFLPSVYVGKKKT